MYASITPPRARLGSWCAQREIKGSAGGKGRRIIPVSRRGIAILEDEEETRQESPRKEQKDDGEGRMRVLCVAGGRERGGSEREETRMDTLSRTSEKRGGRLLVCGGRKDARREGGGPRLSTYLLPH